jgi:hypothetical protein
MGSANRGSGPAAAGPASRFSRWPGSPPLTLLAVALGVMMVGLDGTINDSHLVRALAAERR